MATGTGCMSCLVQEPWLRGGSCFLFVTVLVHELILDLALDLLQLGPVTRIDFLD